MRNSLMYKMSYNRFAELFGGHPAQDRVRGQGIPATSPTLDTLGEWCGSRTTIAPDYPWPIVR
jgi:dolichyl-diphosphooligosaccharide--protein glycosyltransferase